MLNPAKLEKFKVAKSFPVVLFTSYTQMSLQIIIQQARFEPVISDFFFDLFHGQILTFSLFENVQDFLLD